MFPETCLTIQFCGHMWHHLEAFQTCMSGSQHCAPVSLPATRVKAFRAVPGARHPFLTGLVHVVPLRGQSRVLGGVWGRVCLSSFHLAQHDSDRWLHRAIFFLRNICLDRCHFHLFDEINVDRRLITGDCFKFLKLFVEVKHHCSWTIQEMCATIFTYGHWKLIDLLSFSFGPCWLF